MELTREQKLELRKEIETKYADILADYDHPLYDDVRAAMMAPGVDLASINWHPAVAYSEENQPVTDDHFVNGKCAICGETPATCECHQ